MKQNTVAFHILSPLLDVQVSRPSLDGVLPAPTTIGPMWSRERLDFLARRGV